MLRGDSLPGGLLFQPGDVGHVEHDSKEEQWLIAKLVQLLFEGFLQFHPTLSRGLGLPLEPQAEVMGLETREAKTRGRSARNTSNGDEGKERRVEMRWGGSKENMSYVSMMQ